MCTNRFDDDTKNSFVELYTKVDSGVNVESYYGRSEKVEVEDQLKDDNDSESDSEEDSSGY